MVLGNAERGTLNAERGTKRLSFFSVHHSAFTPLNQCVKELSWNLASPRRSQIDVLLVRPVEITSAGHDQSEALRQLGELLDQLFVVIAVDHFDAGQAMVDQIF